MWTADSYGNDWSFTAGGGGIGASHVTYYARAVRCVRGTPQQGEFADSGDGTVVDLGTGSMWQTSLVGTTVTWQQALDACNGSDVGGHQDWRLPGIKELQSLLWTTATTGPTPGFGGGRWWSVLWSSTTGGTSHTGAWVRGPDDFITALVTKTGTGTGAALCVRNLP